MIGAEGKNATANGKLLYEATKANYLANTFLSAFKTADSPQAKSIFTELGKDVAFKSQNKYFAEAVQELGTDRLLAERGFSIEDVKLGNGVFDVSKIRQAIGANTKKLQNDLNINIDTLDVIQDFYKDLYS